MRTQVDHRLPGRVRVRVAGLRGDAALARRLAAGVAAHPGVTRLDADARTGRALVCFDPGLLDEATVLDRIEQELAPAYGLEADRGWAWGAAEVAVPAGLFALLAARRIAFGPSAIAGAVGLFVASAAVRIVRNYATLRGPADVALRRLALPPDRTLEVAAVGLHAIDGDFTGLALDALSAADRREERLQLNENLRRYGGRPGAPRPGPTSERLATFERRLSAPALLLAGLTMLLSRDASAALGVLLASEPSAARAGVQAARNAALQVAASHGVLALDGEALERFGDCDTLAFEGLEGLGASALDVGDVVPLGELTEDEILAIAAALARATQDPWAEALRAGAAQRGVAARGDPATEVRPDGVIGEEGERRWLLGPAPFVYRRRVGTSWAAAEAHRLEAEGQVPLHLARDNELIALIGVRPRDQEAILAGVEALRAAGLPELVLLGDDDLGLHQVCADALGLAWRPGPAAEQAGWLAALRADGRRVALLVGGEAGSPLGDEANLVIGRASGAPGERGTPGRAPSGSHLLLYEASLAALARALTAGRTGARVAEQNLLLASGFVQIGSLAALFNWLPARTLGRLGHWLALLLMANGNRWTLDRLGHDRKRPRPRPAPSSAENPAAAAPARAPTVAWHALDVADVLTRLDVTQAGLSEEEASLRRRRYGANTVTVSKGVSWPRILLGQVVNPVSSVLIAAAALSFVVRDPLNGVSILGLLALNGVLGTIQEYRAERAVEQLQHGLDATAHVRRGGEPRIVKADDVVPGDVLLLEAGRNVPADARLIEAWGLEVHEATLTGEAHAVGKQVARVEAERLLPDRSSLVHRGTHVIRGRGQAVAVATGGATEVGQIARMTEEVDHEVSPLHRQVQQLGRVSLAASLGAGALVAGVGMLRRLPPGQMLMTGVGVASAAIPEGLTTFLTLALASGAVRMARRRAPVKRLASVETLGRVTAICSDKTGTLTRNEMVVSTVVIGHRRWTTREDDPEALVLERGAEWKGHADQAPERGQRTADVLLSSEPGDPESELRRILGIGVLCNDADDHRGDGALGSDPTENALYHAAQRAGIWIEGARDTLPRVRELPFDAARGQMSVLCYHQKAHQYVLLSKGAVETLVDCSSERMNHGVTTPFNEAERERFRRQAAELGAQGLRTLAVGYRILAPGEHERPIEKLERDLVFAGLIAMHDPPREGVKDAVAWCRDNGIRVLMITGDHPTTAASIGRELGIIDDGGRVVSGAELEAMSEPALADAIDQIRVFARVTPRHKLRIVEALRARGHVVAMTGDGVNDAPAVKRADVGVAMGRAGTDVTKEAAVVVLADDNFANIAEAVRLGREVHGTIRRSIGFLTSGNLGEVITVLAALVAGLPPVFTPSQLLLVNLLSDGLPISALILAPSGSSDHDAAPGVQVPRWGIDPSLHRPVLGRAALVGAISLGLFGWGLGHGGVARARSLAFAGLIGNQLVQLPDWHPAPPGPSERRERAWVLGGAAVGSYLAMLAATQVPWLRRLFALTPLTLRDAVPLLGSHAATLALSRVLLPVASLGTGADARAAAAPRVLREGGSSS